MPSPFPGMDPWLEDEEVFPDLHGRLLLYMSEVLNAGMPPGYVSTTKNRVWVDDVQRREPDVSVFGRDRHSRNDTTTEPAVATLSGLHALGEDREPEPWEEPYLEIVTAKGRRLVTAIEILSLSNKASGGKGRKAYLDKHEEFRLGGVNVVEIDLLRGGLYTTAVPRPRLERIDPTFSYHVSVLMVGKRNRFFGAAIKMTDRLPAIGIPLDPGVEPVTVDLQPLLDRAYDTGLYSELVDYRSPCQPPLTPEQQAWADSLLKAQGLRP
ncbi:DUF4058 family protein [Limnoglobus roseus]|uniref:DUF4058 domain-containing protein n=1 Tax=Limnoglobus roseus TaxID=2598579 RepID=A0A5C1A6G1_9BACT|nr:DUF4058 family protein [Limnoglobus roseus]QEL13807.1 hypothetical protein PX52LOC_00665 [Limnoglobus roseus]